MNLRRIGLVFLVLVVVAGGAAIGGRFGRVVPYPSPQDEVRDNPAMLGVAEALALIESHHAAAPATEQLMRSAVLGALHTLDPHSSFFDRREFSEMQDEQSSRFYGIGVTINQRAGRIYVLGTGPGMPAERAGLRYGDAIIAVDGEATRGWTQGDALKRVRGERGTPVEITVERLGAKQPLTFRIVRDEVPFPSVKNYFMLKPGVGYIALTGGFNQTTGDEVRDAIQALKRQGLSALVLDLRRNPGGLFRQAVEVAEEFLPRRVEIVTVRSRQTRAARLTYQSENDEPETMPLVVLINGETASASEIVAGAIQDRDRGLIVGEASFGKGLVQTVFRLPGGTGLTLTTAKYYTPSGRSIQREYAGVGFYDYYYAGRSSRRRGPSASQIRQARETVFTPTGRRLSSGGGIEPDIVVRAPEEDLALRDACFEFARRLLAGLLPGLESWRVSRPEPGRALRGNEFLVTEPVIAAFRAFLREQAELKAIEVRVADHLDYVRRRIRAEAITAACGLETAEQFSIESDPQALRAIEALPQAKHLSDLARIFPAGGKER